MFFCNRASLYNIQDPPLYSMKEIFNQKVCRTNFSEITILPHNTLLELSTFWFSMMSFICFIYSHIWHHVLVFFTNILKTRAELSFPHCIEMNYLQRRNLRAIDKCDQQCKYLSKLQHKDLGIVFISQLVNFAIKVHYWYVLLKRGLPRSLKHTANKVNRLQ